MSGVDIGFLYRLEGLAKGYEQEGKHQSLGYAADLRLAIEYALTGVLLAVAVKPAAQLPLETPQPAD